MVSFTAPLVVDPTFPGQTEELSLFAGHSVENESSFFTVVDAASRPICSVQPTPTVKAWLTDLRSSPAEIIFASQLSIQFFRARWSFLVKMAHPEPCSQGQEQLSWGQSCPPSRLGVHHHPMQRVPAPTTPLVPPTVPQIVLNPTAFPRELRPRKRLRKRKRDQPVVCYKGQYMGSPDWSGQIT